MLSEIGSADAIKNLESDRRVDWRTNLLPRDVCENLVARMDAEPTHCTPSQADQLVQRLLRNYPDFKAKDHSNSLAAWAEILETFRFSVGYRAMGPEGLPALLEFNPKTANIKKSLDAEQARWVRIRSNALWHNQERDDRDTQKIAEAEEAKQDRINRLPDVVARRKAALESLKAGFAKTDEKLSLGRKLPPRPPPTAEELAESLKRCMAVQRME